MFTAGYGVKYPGKLEGQILSAAATNELAAFKELEELSLEDNPDMKLPNELGNFVSRSDYVVDDYQKDSYFSEFTTLKLMKVVFIDGGIPWLEERV